jgi:hypothetical protein
MISPKFYSQTVKCPVCAGWGTTEFPSTNYKDLCRECVGRGVFVSQTENIYVWDAPTFIDYRSRTRAIVLKILAVFLLIAFLFFIFIVLKSMVVKTFNI